ncbi:MAG: hypothetical protein F6K23_38205 [Okeania sp. SIO2C9]|uniref:hypothetical protein n=1 Tax=Okeania sp. SIO2C9 TaxID=2607791 RepID=UPI0013C26F4D|nr:hypothetical protein [Okeania sp. SIO2C9]NEQ78310.1 hypothetical protein [Okeania sp. SIO2C9]
MKEEKNLPRPRCLDGWQEGVLPNQGIVFIAPQNLGREDAMAVYSQCESWLQAVANIWGEVRLTWVGANYGLRKLSEIPSNCTPILPMTEQSQNLIIPELDLDLNELYQRTHPCYLTEMVTQKVIWMNLKAIEVNRLKTPSKVIGSSCTSLWNGDSMEKMMRHLLADKFVHQFETQGYHWVDQWRREKITTVSEYGLVTVFGTECRLCETLEYQVLGVD